jgi:hypothetical protein
MLATKYGVGDAIQRAVAHWRGEEPLILDDE